MFLPHINCYRLLLFRFSSLSVLLQCDSVSVIREVSSFSTLYSTHTPFISSRTYLYLDVFDSDALSSLVHFVK